MSKLSKADIESAYRDFGVAETPQLYEKKKIKTKVPKETKGSDGFVRFTESGKPVHVFASHLDQNAWQQASFFADLPFVHEKGMALMPDVHFGKNVPIGSVLPTVGVLVPAAVGVDIGCGMLACQLNIKASDLPENLRKIRSDIERAVPMGSSGRHKNPEEDILREWNGLKNEYQALENYSPKIIKSNSVEQLGTLGSGNHFIEICIDESKNIWVMIHSGSRGPGSLIGQYFIDQALHRVREDGVDHKGFGWLHDNDPLFDGYVHSVNWAQNYAKVNRKTMMARVIQVMERHINKKIVFNQKVVSCHHNYLAKEEHAGETLWVTRKGAISAQRGELGIIPSAMGQESFIVEGLGFEKSWCSCSHGSGRLMSRTAATQRFTSKDMKEALRGVECRKDRGVIDEIPYAYKNIRQVMKDQTELTKIVHTLKAVICCKGM